MRRLLVDQHPTLQVLRKLNGQRGEPKVLSVDLPKDSSAAIFASGGEVAAGTRIEQVSVHHKALSAEEVKRLYEASKREREEEPPKARPVSVWLSSPGIRVRGVKISRREIIKFVANKLGGVHWDPNRNETPGDRALDQLRTSPTVQVMELDLVYNQLGVIVRELLASREVEELLQQAEGAS